LILKNLHNQPINYATIRKILKKNKLNQYYKHINFIMDQFNNEKQIFITEDMKNKIINEFKKFELLFHKNKLLDRKKKILSYNFLLYKILIKLKYFHILPRLNYPLISRMPYYLSIWKQYESFESI